MRQNIKSRISELKKTYWNIKISDNKVQDSWKEFERKLRPAPRLSFPGFRHAVISFGLMIAFLAGLVGIVQASDPGTPLYQLKLISDKVAAKIAGKPGIKIERRGQDLIKALKKDGEKFEEANNQYNRALEETQKEVQKDQEKKVQLENSLNKQQESFKKTIKENPKAESKLEKALEKTQDVKENLNIESGGAYGTKQEQGAPTALKEEKKEEKQENTKGNSNSQQNQGGSNKK